MTTPCDRWKNGTDKWSGSGEKERKCSSLGQNSEMSAGHADGGIK